MEKINFQAIIIASVITGLVTGTISSITTVKALNVHIAYLQENSSKNERAIVRTNVRIDRMEVRIK